MNGRIGLVAAVCLGVFVGLGCGGSDEKPPITPEPEVTLPQAPSNVVAVPGDGQATVTWGAPSDGGSAILEYIVQVFVGDSEARTVTAPASETQAIITDLENGTAYAFSVVARNARGRGAASARSDAVTPHVTPGAVQNLVAVAGNQHVALSWEAADDKGMPLGGYVVTVRSETSEDATVTVPATELGTTFSALTNGTAYTFIVTADNGHARGPEASVEATPFTTPGAPRVTATTGSERVTLSWTVEDTGGSIITNYRVTAYLGDEVLRTVETSEPRLRLEELENATTYQFTVEAMNAAGWGEVSERISAMPTRAPSEPLNARCQGGDGWISFTWEPPEFDFGHPVTEYRLSAVINGNSTSWHTTELVYHVTEVPNDRTPFTFYIQARNAAGYGDGAELYCSTWPPRP
ncbi:fibronectin type III domain-containing protein [Myxococcus sp. Y35]|uniref:fibronectin type III domain-containing protein n=1 Tax=Pseudomyxococcus flavus TaxID=3115648 RepID=UPI003CEEA16E